MVCIQESIRQELVSLPRDLIPTIRFLRFEGIEMGKQKKRAKEPLSSLNGSFHLHQKILNLKCCQNGMLTDLNITSVVSVVHSLGLSCYEVK